MNNNDNLQTKSSPTSQEGKSLILFSFHKKDLHHQTAKENWLYEECADKQFLQDLQLFCTTSHYTMKYHLIPEEIFQIIHSNDKVLISRTFFPSGFYTSFFSSSFGEVLSGQAPEVCQYYFEKTEHTRFYLLLKGLSSIFLSLLWRIRTMCHFSMRYKRNKKLQNSYSDTENDLI